MKLVCHEPGSVDSLKTTLVSLAVTAENERRFNELRRRIAVKSNAAVAAGWRTGFWRMSGRRTVQRALRYTISKLRLPRLYVSAQA